ncbi:MAG: 30S ribosomal protein S15 [Nanoarchaeota archaeon]
MSDEQKTNKEQKIDWVKIKPAELEKLVIELHKEGKTPAQIGMALRDNHGIPRAKLIGKRISHIITSHNLSPITEKIILEARMKKLNEHIKNKKHDLCAKRSLAKKQWIIRKLSQ